MIKISISLFASGFFLSIGPCLASCGPLLITYIASSNKNYKEAFYVWFIFSLARIGTYCFLGAFVGVLSEIFLNNIFPAFIGKYITLFGGIFIALIGIGTFLGEGRESRLCSFFHNHFIKKDKKSIIIFGIIVGVSPCAPLIGIFSTIGLMSHNIMEGFLFSLSFGLGTLFSPILLLAVLAGSIEKFLRNSYYRIVFNRLAGIIIVMLGIFVASKAILF